MDLQGLQLLSTDKQREIIDRMSLTDRAKIKPWPDDLTAEGIHRFPDYLSIEEIGGLLFPFPAWDLKKAFKDQLIDACIDDKLPYEGTIPSWRYPKNKKPHPSAQKGSKVSNTVKGFEIGGTVKEFKFGNVAALSQLGFYPEDCTIHKNEFKRYVESIGQLALVNKGLLAGWWVEDAEETSKPDDTQLTLRLNDLTEYFKAQEDWGFPGGEVLDEKGAYYFPYTVDELLARLKKREETTKKKTRKKLLWNTKEMDKIMWNSNKRKAICYGNGRGIHKKISQN